MLLSDLIGLPVTGPDGPLGYVLDCRFVLDGAPRGLLADARLAGLVVGPRRHGTFLGYERSGMRGPAPLATWLRWRERGAFVVEWGDVARVGSAGIEVRDGFSRWSSNLPSRGGLP